MSETAPCPWCEDGGKPFLQKEHHPQFAYAMVCTSCGARGPHVKFTHSYGREGYEGMIAPVMEEATRLWNIRVEVQEEELPADEGPLLVTMVG